MCLRINSYSTRFKRKVRREGKKIIAYKVLKIRGNKLYSPYMETLWPRNKIMISNRKEKDSTRLTKLESNCEAIYKGLHFYSNLDRAYEELNLFIEKTCIYKIEIDPKDIIAFGNNDVVAHKAKIIGLVRKLKKK